MAQAMVTVTTVSNKAADQFPTALAYLRDLVPGSLPQSIEDCLQNDVELRHHLPVALITARPVRQLEFGANITPRDHKSYGTRHLWINIGALLVYITGLEKTERCIGKFDRADCKKKFARCVVPDDKLDYGPRFKNPKTAACANHQYDAEWSKCELRGDMIRPGDQDAVAKASGGGQPTGTHPDGQQTPHRQTPDQSAPSFVGESGHGMPHEPAWEHDTFGQATASPGFAPFQDADCQGFGPQAASYAAAYQQTPTDHRAHHLQQAAAYQFPAHQGPFDQMHLQQARASSQWPASSAPAPAQMPGVVDMDDGNIDAFHPGLYALDGGSAEQTSFLHAPAVDEFAIDPAIDPSILGLVHMTAAPSPPPPRDPSAPRFSAGFGMPASPTQYPPEGDVQYHPIVQGLGARGPVGAGLSGPSEMDIEWDQCLKELEGEEELFEHLGPH